MRIRPLPSLGAIAGILAFAAIPLAASAAPNVPSYASVPSYAASEDTIHGSISSFNGAYTMFVRDARGYIDNVSLHDGTIINPTGLRLQPGMSVTVLGHPRGSTFEANEIDTPYHFSHAYPVYPAYPAYPVYQPYYGGYGYPYGYGYGYGPFYPRYGIGFSFGRGSRRW